MFRYAATLLAGIALLLTGFAGFNSLVDPFDVTAAPDIPGVNERRSRIRQDGGRVWTGDRLARGGHGSVLLGSSRTVDGFPREPENWPGGVLNAGMRGSNMFELARAMGLAAGDPQLRCVIIGLDLDEFGTHGKTRATYFLSALADGRRDLALARTALSPSTFGASLRTIADNLTGAGPRVPWADAYEPGLQRTRYESGLRGLHGFYLGYRYDGERMDYFETALDALTAAGVQVIGHIHPLHAWREEMMIRSGRGDEYFALRERLTALFDAYGARAPAAPCVDGGAAVLWDFSGFQDVAVAPAPGPGQTAAHPFFYEPSHYLPLVGQAMLDRMQGLDGEGVFALERFGVRLSGETLAASAEAVHRRRAAWLATPDGEAATAYADAVIAARPAPQIQPPQFLSRDDWLQLRSALARLPDRADAG